jgi:hypothetical protein
MERGRDREGDRVVEMEREREKDSEPDAGESRQRCENK